jgi:uncharacterized protein YxjI
VQGNCSITSATSAKVGTRSPVIKKWFRIADGYGVQIEQGQDDILVLAVIVAVDMMAHAVRPTQLRTEY